MATQLGYTKIYAPIDGIVSVRVAKQGEVVAQGSPIVVVVDVDHLWVRADVEESYIDSVVVRPEAARASCLPETSSKGRCFSKAWKMILPRSAM